MSQPCHIFVSMYSQAAFDRAVLRGIARFARLNCSWVFYLPDRIPQWEPISMTPVKQIAEGKKYSLLQVTRKLGIMGFIGRLQSDDMARKMLQTGMPVVAMELHIERLPADHPVAEISEILPNSVEVGRWAAEHFLERGFQRFAYCGIAGRLWSERRREGFSARLQEACFPCSIYEPPANAELPSWDNEERLICQWIKSLEKPVAVMACNDVRGRQVLEACMIGGWKVPEEIAVLGVDNDELLCDLSNPPLSSIQFDGETVGYQAAEFLSKRIAGEDLKTAVFIAEPQKIVVRRSTDIVAVEDPHVASAMRFIRENIQHLIGVADVVEHAKTSRRTLEMRFQRCLRRSIREEIQDVRLNRVKQFLTETNLSLRTIARLSGFHQLTYLSRVFRQETGRTLMDYRQQTRSL
ncbi:MAG: DNA-binding transcriptional regulator [Pirellulales bacterium]|nr:DNA-binding transcriptional regulator [Pirellulales bacterium]